jgi:polyphosphate glucokinase
MQVLGIDIGGSSIKAAPVDLMTGALLVERLRLEIPEQLSPAAMTLKLAEVVERFDWQGPVGIGFPAALRKGVVLTAANIAPEWLGVDLLAQFASCCPGAVGVINDADAAGLAELKFGAGLGAGGVVLLVTVGTGLGTALFVDGRLLPNTELGHLFLDQVEAEWFASDAARKREHLSWPAWTGRFEQFLQHLERLFWPDLIIVGGGTSYHYEKFLPGLRLATRIVPAQLFNDAGIVGAALTPLEV